MGENAELVKIVKSIWGVLSADAAGIVSTSLESLNITMHTIVKLTGWFEVLVSEFPAVMM